MPNVWLVVYYRHDKEYGMKRRLALEEYLRALVKIPLLKKVSYALHEFVNSEETELFTPEDMIYFEDYEKEKRKRWWADDNGIIYEILNFDGELTINETENGSGGHTDSRDSVHRDFESDHDTGSGSSRSGTGSSSTSKGSSDSDHHKKEALDSSDDSPTNSQDSQNSNNEEIRNINIQEDGDLHQPHHNQQQQQQQQQQRTPPASHHRIIEGDAATTTTTDEG